MKSITMDFIKNYKLHLMMMIMYLAIIIRNLFEIKVQDTHCLMIQKNTLILSYCNTYLT